MSPQVFEQAGIIRIVDENLRYGFAQIPRPVLRAKHLSPKAKLVYSLLLDYAWFNDYVFPGQQTIADDLDISLATVKRALTELRAYKLIDWKQQGLNKPNIYFILPLTECPALSSCRTAQNELSRSSNLHLPDSSDRKSTRLNSSHANISYAVFCLKKKQYNTKNNRTQNTATNKSTQSKYL